MRNTLFVLFFAGALFLGSSAKEYSKDVTKLGNITEEQCWWLSPSQDQFDPKCSTKRPDGYDPDKYLESKGYGDDKATWSYPNGIDRGCSYAGGFTHDPTLRDQLTAKCNNLCNGLHFYKRSPTANCHPRKLKCKLVGAPDITMYARCQIVSVSEPNPAETKRDFLPKQYVVEDLLNADQTGAIRTREQCKYYCPSQLGHSDVESSTKDCKWTPKEGNNPRDLKNLCDISGVSGAYFKKISIPDKGIENACVIGVFKGEDATKKCDELCSGWYFTRGLGDDDNKCQPVKFTCKSEVVSKGVDGYYCILIETKSTSFFSSG